MTIGLDGSGRADIVAGGYKELEALWAERAAKARKAPAKSASPVAATPATQKRKLSFKDQHDLDRLPGEIAKLEAAIAAVAERLSDAGLYSRNPSEFQRLTAEADTLRAKLAATEERWLEVAEMAEALTA
jgi:ATP-binding cassette subfamily F protein uup